MGYLDDLIQKQILDAENSTWDKFITGALFKAAKANPGKALLIFDDEEMATCQHSNFVNASEYGSSNEPLLDGEIGKYMGHPIILISRVKK